MTNKNETNFLKIILLLMNYGSKVLQHRIEFELRIRKWQQVTDFLVERKHDILHLTLDRHKRCCINNCSVQISTKNLLHKGSLELMFDDVKRSCSKKFIHCCSCKFIPKSDLDISTWDITLTSCLLLEVIGFDDPGQKQAIKNLRDLRNSKELLHRGNAEMKDEEYKEIRKNLSNNIKEIAEKCERHFFSSICTELEEIKTKPLTRIEVLQLQEYWKEFKSNDQNKSMSSMWKTSTLQQDIEMEDITYYSKTAFEEHKEKIDMYVEPNNAMKHGINELGEKNIIIVTGDAGIGKTSFAFELMSRMQKKNQSFTALVLTDSSQWNKLDFEREYILLIDDTFGKSKLHECVFQSWCTIFDRMDKRLKTGKVMVIFALRNCIWHLIKDRLSNYSLFRAIVFQNAQVNLSGEFGLTLVEKLRILGIFCKRFNVKYCHTLYEEETLSKFLTDGLVRLSHETITTILNMDTSCGFPFLCEQSFSDSKISNKSILNVFQIHSNLTYMKELVDDLLYQQKNIHYAVLVFLFLEDKSCNVDAILKAKRKIVGLGMVNSSEIIPAKIKGCLKDMMNVYIDTSDDGGFKLRHKRIYYAVLLSFGENFPRKFLEFISKTILFSNVRSEGYVAKKRETFVRFDDDMTLSLANKLIDVYGANKEEAFSEVYKHPSFQDKKLVDCFLDITANDETLTTHLHSFIAGACQHGNDILASEVIRRCVNSNSVDTNILNMVFQFDLVYTFREYLQDLSFKKSFVKSLREKSVRIQFFKFVINRGARQCIMEMLYFFDTEGKELMAEGEKQSMICELTNIMQVSLDKILSLHNPYCGEDWTDVLIKLSKMCQDPEAKRMFLMNIILTSSINHAKLDIAYTFLEMIEPFRFCVVNEFMNLIFLFNNEHLFRVLCKRMKKAQFQIDTWRAAELCICYTRLYRNEKMLNCFMSEFKCNFNCICFYFQDITILHACEIANFSDSTLLRLLLRPEGRFMLTSKDTFFGRTPVQCRAAYKKIRRLDRSGTPRYSSVCLRVQDIDWRDDAIVVYSSFKYSSIVSGFSKLECQPPTKDW